MRNSIELQQAINIKSVMRHVRRLGAPELLVKDDGYYGEYGYDYLNSRDGQWRVVTVLLDFTTPNYGGLRYWLVCRNCERRVSKLYLATADSVACRHCLKLEYASRQFAHNPLLLNFCNSHRTASLVYRRQQYAGKPTRAGRRLAKYTSHMQEYPLP